jgi:hypothetical protein
MRADVAPAPDSTGSAAPEASVAPSAAAQKGAAPSAPQTKPASTAKPAAPRPFDIRAAMKSVQEAANRAKFFCKSYPGAKVIPMTVFFAPSGAVQRIQIPPDVAGSQTALCARAQVNMARAPEFDGKALEPVDTTVALP